MFFLFSFLCYSLDLIQFNQEEFDLLALNSTEKPVFALMYADWCPMCKGKKEAFMDFYNKQKKDANISFMLVNCLDRSWCGSKGAFSIPYWFVMSGPDPFKWESTNSPDPKEWQKLVDEATAGPVIEIEGGAHGKRIVNTMHGSSYFHLVIQRDHKDILEKYTKLATKFRPFGNRFTVRYKPRTKVSLRVYRSPYCMYKIKGDIGNFDWFIETNRLSYLHYYRESELSQINTSKPRALYFVDRQIVQTQFNSFLNITQDYCGKIEFGLSTNLDKDIFTPAGLTEADIPFMLLHSHTHNCDLYYKKHIMDGGRLRYYDHLIQNQTCNSFREGYIKKRDPNMIMFCLLGMIGTAALCALFIEVRRLLISMKLE